MSIPTDIDPLELWHWSGGYMSIPTDQVRGSIPGSNPTYFLSLPTHSLGLFLGAVELAFRRRILGCLSLSPDDSA